MVPSPRVTSGRREVHASYRRVELRVRAGLIISLLTVCYVIICPLSIMFCWYNDVSCFVYHRCILGELFTKKPIFQANQELAQLELIR